MKPYADMSDTEFAEWAANRFWTADEWTTDPMNGNIWIGTGDDSHIFNPRHDASDAVALVDAYCDNHDRLWRGARAPGGTADRPLQDRFVCDLVPRGAAEPFSVIADGDTFAAAICAAVYAAVEGE